MHERSSPHRAPSTPATALPHRDDPPAVWQRFAASIPLAPADTRDALLAALPTLPEPVRSAVVPVLAHRTRGAGRLAVLAAVERASEAHAPGPAVVYTLVGELLGSAGATRASCVRALARTEPAVRDAVALALAIGAHLPTARPPGGERPRAALAAWRAAGEKDPLGAGVVAVDARGVWRDWLALREPLPAALDNALLLATAGATRGAVDTLRAAALHVVEHRGAASAGACALLRWIAQAAPRAADGAVADALPAAVQNAGWTPAAARALALTAVRAAGVSAALAHVAAQLETADALERATAVATVRLALREARRGPGEASAALTDTVPAFARALASAPAPLAADEPGESYATLVALLLGRDGVAAAQGGAMYGAARFLTPDLRAQVLEVALARPALGARALALADLDAHGVPAVLLPRLRELAQGAGEGDAVTREHARLLVRAARG